MLVPLDSPEKFYHCILSTIDKAQKGDYLHVNYFVIRQDKRGLALIALLYQAIQRGVRVEIVVDSYGSMHEPDDGTEYSGAPLSEELLAFLSEAGATVKIFHKVDTTAKISPRNLKNWKWFTQRNHNKLFVYNLTSCDEKGVVVGDSQWAVEHFMNVFRGNNVLVRGNEVYEQVLSYIHVLINSEHVTEPTSDMLSDEYRRSFGLILDQLYDVIYIDSKWDELLPVFKASNVEFVSNEVNFNCPHKRKTIQHREIELIKGAKKGIWYSTPYFGPDEMMMNAFIDAEKTTGIELKILIAKFRDHPFMPYGTKRAASKLIREGVKIYEYNGVGNIHYKDLIVDDISFIKSANGEGRSRFYNLETGVIIKSASYAAYSRNHMKLDIKQSDKLHKDSRYCEESPALKRWVKGFLCPLYYHHL